ncbi:Glutathione S-transferase kappa 1 [Vulpes lagopus]
MSIWSEDKDILESQSILAAAEKLVYLTEQAQGLLEKISAPQVKNERKGDLQGSLHIWGLGAAHHHDPLGWPNPCGVGSEQMLTYLLEKWLGPVPPAMNATP